MPDDPEVLVAAREEAKTTYRCPNCNASKRADVHHDPEWDDYEMIVIMECRSCGFEQVRYYPK